MREVGNLQAYKWAREVAFGLGEAQEGRQPPEDDDGRRSRSTASEWTDGVRRPERHLYAQAHGARQADMVQGDVREDDSCSRRVGLRWISAWMGLPGAARTGREEGGDGLASYAAACDLPWCCSGLLAASTLSGQAPARGLDCRRGRGIRAALPAC